MREMAIKDYVEIFELENTNIIYDGIKRLWEQLLAGRIRKSQDVVDQIVKMYKECRTREGYLAQNLMSEFFRFLNFTSQTELTVDEAEAIGGMVLFYDKVLEMEHNHDQMGIQKTYLEDYSDICDFLSMIAMKMDSYLVHVRDSGNLILASSASEHDRSDEEFIYKINKKDSKATVQYGDTVVFVPSKSEGEKQKILIKLLLSRRKDVEYKQTVYIVLIGKNEINRVQCMGIARNILFLRQQIQLLLERDLYALRHFKISYEDVKPIQDNKQYNILHISDLHIDTINYKVIKKLIQETNFGPKNDTEQSCQIDLIVITGDVAQGQSTAMDMEENYRKAEEVIRCLAHKIWRHPDKDKNMRFDWRKRIIIIPGNHDYASMNELLVVHKDRATSGGEPAREEGSPMIKYTYYIDFLRRLLDLDISDIVKQNLNDYRVYPNYNLEIVCFNTISEVSMLRNNKVQIDKMFLKNFSEEEQNDHFKIYLMHHTPLYVKQDMDYNKDKYGYSDIDDTLYSSLEYLGENYGKRVLSKDKLNEMKRQLMNINEPGKNTRIYRDVDYLYSHCEELTNERCNQIINEYRKNEKMRDKDRAIYEVRLAQYMNIIRPDVILGGHTHVQREGKYCGKREKKHIPCYEAAKFYMSDTSQYLNYGILTINTETKQGHNIEYNSYNSKISY